MSLIANQTRYGYVRAAVWWYGNGTEMHWTQNEGKFVVAERFIRILKTKIYRHITTVSKNMYSKKLDKIVDKYNKIYQRTVKMKPAIVVIMTWILNSEKVSIWKYQNTKIFLLRATLQIGPKKIEEKT